MSARAKVIRRIVFYTLVLVYIVVHLAEVKHDLLFKAIFAAASVYAIAQLVEDINNLWHDRA
jgi:hypothetical protein